MEASESKFLRKQVRLVPKAVMIQQAGGRDAFNEACCVLSCNFPACRRLVIDARIDVLSDASVARV